MKTIKFPRGCEMTLYIPLVVLSAGGREGVDAEQLTDVSVGVSLHKERVALTPTLFENFLSVVLPATLKAGSYVIDYGFKYMGRPVAGVLADRLDIVADNAQSNWQGYVSDGKAYLSDQIFIAGPLLTDEELEALKAEYESAIVALNAAEAAALAAKEEFDRKAENIESLGDMAKESTLNAGVNAIRQDISQIHVDVPENIATKDDVEAVTDHLDNITDVQVSRTQESIGTLSDKLSNMIGNDPEGNTVNDKLDSFAQELDKIGSPAEGQPATLFGAIAAGGGGGGSEEIMAKLNDIEKALKKADVQSSFEGYKFADGFNSLSLLDFLRVANDKNIVEIYDDSATKISTEQFVSLAANATAKKVTFTKVVETYLSNPIVDVFGGSSNNVLEELNLPKLSVGGSYGYLRYYSALKRVSIPNLSNIYDQDSYSFISAQNLIDIEFGKAVTTNVNFLQRWSPTNALSSSSTTLVGEGEPFASNLEKLLYNIREHIAANLPSISATIKFSAAVKAAILADSATASAFTSKGWTIA